MENKQGGKTMDFTEMRDLLNKHFMEKMYPQSFLYEMNLDKDKLWNIYLDSFPKGTNEIYRERRYHDCSCCRGFIKHIGNVVAIVDGKIISIWDFDIEDSTFGPVVKALSDYVHKHSITDVFLSSEHKVVCHHNFELMESVGQYRWDHFFIDLGNKHFVNSYDKGTDLNKYRTAKQTFKRALEEITLDATNILLELISDNSIYRGNEWQAVLKAFKNHKLAYANLKTEKEKDIYTWEHSVKENKVLTGLRNTSIGTLLVDISNGRDLEEAVRAYEAITDPTVYKHPKPIFTEKMRKDAEKKITELGFIPSLARRFATLDDITVNDILFTDRSAANRIKGAESIFDELAKDVVSKPKKFDRVEEVSVKKFVDDILPTANSIQVYVENSHKPNFVSLIAPKNIEAKSLFKWGNNFTWAYTGNLTDSFKQKVKEFGGNVEGVLRFSIKWNESGKDNVDLDAHCKLPSGHIYYGDKMDHRSGGCLDVDIQRPSSQVPGNDKTAVENITWQNKSKMPIGDYAFYVNQYCGNLSDGFRAEIEFDGNIYSFDYPKGIRQGQNVNVAIVTLDKNGTFTIKPSIECSNTPITIWNISTSQFVPVTSIMYSPNYWSTADVNVGHQHIFFMLDGCVNDENPSGIFNEFLVNELNENKRVMAALGSRLKVEDTDDQLSGLGFALDKRNEVVVKVIGTSERIIKIKF